MASWNCPTCGAPVEVENRFARMVTCDFCGHVLLMHNGRLEDSGRIAQLVELPSPLFVGATGTLRGERFRVLGRLQYEYDAGTWQEWYLVFDDEDAFAPDQSAGDDPFHDTRGRGWLVEDGGTYTIYRKTTLSAAGPAPDDVPVGRQARIAGMEVFVTEVGTATIVGGEGQLGFQLLPGEEVRYVDGSAGGRQVTLEVGSDEVEFMVGTELPPSALAVDDPY